MIAHARISVYLRGRVIHSVPNRSYCIQRVLIEFEMRQNENGVINNRFRLSYIIRRNSTTFPPVPLCMFFVLQSQRTLRVAHAVERGWKLKSIRPSQSVVPIVWPIERNSTKRTFFFFYFSFLRINTGVWNSRFTTLVKHDHNALPDIVRTQWKND